MPGGSPSVRRRRRRQIRGRLIIILIPPLSPSLFPYKYGGGGGLCPPLNPEEETFTLAPLLASLAVGFSAGDRCLPIWIGKKIFVLLWRKKGKKERGGKPPSRKRKRSWRERREGRTSTERMRKAHSVSPANALLQLVT